MDARTQQPPAQPESAGTPRTPADDRSGPDIDLDRMVWDPEYRRAMRPFLKNNR